MKYAIVIERTKTGYSAYAPDVPGCGATGKTVRQVKRMLTEALELHIESLREHGEAVPKPTTRTDYVAA